MKITKREVCLGCIVLALAFVIGLAITMAVSNANNDKVRLYETSVKINEDSAAFQHALETKQSNICAYGLFDGGSGVTDPLIDGQYYSIERVYQHYTYHTRTITTMVNGRAQTTSTPYYSWDTAKREKQFSTDSLFLNTSLPIQPRNYTELTTVKTDSDDRIVFNIIPLKQYGLIHAADLDAESIEFKPQTMKEYADSLDSNIVPVIIWLSLAALSLGIVITIFYSDWRWLNKY